MGLDDSYPFYWALSKIRWSYLRKIVIFLYEGQVKINVFLLNDFFEVFECSMNLVQTNLVIVEINSIFHSIITFVFSDIHYQTFSFFLIPLSLILVFSTVASSMSFGFPGYRQQCFITGLANIYVLHVTCNLYFCILWFLNVRCWKINLLLLLFTNTAHSFAFFVNIWFILLQNTLVFWTQRQCRNIWLFLQFTKIFSTESFPILFCDFNIPFETQINTFIMITSVRYGTYIFTIFTFMITRVRYGIKIFIIFIFIIVISL